MITVVWFECRLLWGEQEGDRGAVLGLGLRGGEEGWGGNGWESDLHIFILAFVGSESRS